MRTRGIVCLILALLGGSAHGRQEDGSLSLIQTPNEGVPALLVPGDGFDVTLTVRPSEVRLVDQEGMTHSLVVTWKETESKRVRGRCVTPATLSSGSYALEAVGGDGADRVPRAVFVRDSFPGLYAFTHVTDVHVGIGDASTMFRKLIETINASQSAFVVITGDITQSGTPEQFREFLEILNTCKLPTFVCAGNHDRLDVNYQRYFGPGAYDFTFGKDGYIVFDTKDYHIAPELGVQDGLLQAARRKLKPCRWVIGATHRFDPDMGMRSQLVLFVDDPLDHLFVGHEHRANREGEVNVPWGTTPITLTPAAKDGAYRTVIVSVSGVGPQPFALIEGAPPPRRRERATAAPAAAP